MSKHIRGTVKALELVRDTHPDVNLSALLMLLVISLADKDGVSMADLEKQLGLSQAGCSRNVALLTDTNRHREEGAGLITRHEDPMNRRTKVVRLSPKGVRFMAQFKQHLE